MIDGSTRLVGLIGWPVEHSLSPAMHNAAFESLNLNWRYVTLPVRPGDIASAVRGLAALGFDGANVTVPYKTTTIASVDTLSSEARAIGAVNTLLVRRDEAGAAVIHGENTDHVGLIAAIRGSDTSISGECAVVVGAGGVARAAVYGLARAGAREVVVLARRSERADAVAADFADLGCAIRPALLATDALAEVASAAAILINATPVGMTPDTDATIWPDDIPVPSDLLVYDLVYAPCETRLLRHAASCGARTLGGMEMLIEQGARAFSLWTGNEAPIGVMRGACEDALRRRST